LKLLGLSKRVKDLLQILRATTVFEVFVDEARKLFLQLLGRVYRRVESVPQIGAG